LGSNKVRAQISENFYETSAENFMKRSSNGLL